MLLCQSSAITHHLLGGVALKYLRAIKKRRTVLERDPDASIVEPRRVLCGWCNRWISLGASSVEYSRWAWFKHKRWVFLYKRHCPLHSRVNPRLAVQQNTKAIPLVPQRPSHPQARNTLLLLPFKRHAPYLFHSSIRDTHTSTR